MPNLSLKNYGGLYKLRSMLRVQDETTTDGPHLSIMTYDVSRHDLNAERRKIPCDSKIDLHPYGRPDPDQMFYFPRAILVSEILNYYPDILCLQEVDVSNLEFFKQSLSKVGYEMVHLQSSKVRALAICFKRRLFLQTYTKGVTYTTETRRTRKDFSQAPMCSIFLSLRFRKKFSDEFCRSSKSSLIIVSAVVASEKQLAKATYQTAKLMDHIKSFKQHLSSKFGLTDPYVFLTGNFHSTPESPVYISLVSKPLRIRKRYLWQFSDPSEIETLHNSIDMIAASLYAVGYRFTVPKNTLKFCYKGEPNFSNWGPKTQSYFNYIFVISEGGSRKWVPRDSRKYLQAATGVRLLSLLHMPLRERQSGNMPQIGEYPSEKLCMMAEVELL